MFTEINFGKYKDKGLTFPQLVFEDPGYLSYMMQKGYIPARLRTQAEMVVAKACCLELPSEKRETHCVQLLLDRCGKIAEVKITDKRFVREIAADSEMRSTNLNLLIKTDTIGRKLIKAAFKEHWKEGKSATKARVEQFFMCQD